MRHSRPGVIKSVAVGSAILGKIQAGDRDAQHRSLLGPGLVELVERAEHFLVAWFVVFRGYEKSPGLLVTAGRGPARGFKEASESMRVDWFIGERARTPSLLNRLVNWILRWCWPMHWTLHAFRFPRLYLLAGGMTASTSRVMSTLSLTTTPPESSVWFHDT